MHRFQSEIACRAAAALLLAVGLLAACTEFQRDPGRAARDVLTRSAGTVENFRTNRNLGDVFPELRQGVGVVILPRVIRAGFIGGGEGGTGVMLAKRPDGSWSYPAFYTLGGASVGILAGIDDTEVIMVVRNQKALQALVDHQAKLGADISMTAIIVGKGVEGATTAGMGRDIVAFANPIVGLYGGISFDGSVLARRADLNEVFYGAGATPQDILFGSRWQNPEADALRRALAQP